MNRIIDTHARFRVACSAVFGVAALLASAGEAQATSVGPITISSAPTKFVVCTAGDCVPTRVNANLNTSDLDNLLASANVTVEQVARVASGISWASGSTLTLNYDTGSSCSVLLAVDAPISVMGSGGLVFTVGGMNLSGRSNAVPCIAFGPKGHVTFLDLSDTLTIGKNSFTLVDDFPTLASDIAANPKGYYAFAGGFRGSPTGAYSKVPIPTTFDGMIEGLGNSISNLTLADRNNDPAVGMFAHIAANGVVQDVTLAREIIESFGGPKRAYRIGALAGQNDGSIIGCLVSGGVTTKGSFPATPTVIGGLVGYNDGTIVDSEAVSNILGHSASAAGGLVGHNGGTGSIANSYAKGAVKGSDNATGGVGGLVGLNDGTAQITDSYASGQLLAGSGTVGGLVAEIGGTGTITDSYWDMTTSGTNQSAAGTGLTTAQFQPLPAGFSPGLWAVSSSVNGGLPYLLPGIGVP